MSESIYRPHCSDAWLSDNHPSHLEAFLDSVPYRSCYFGHASEMFRVTFLPEFYLTNCATDKASDKIPLECLHSFPCSITVHTFNCLTSDLSKAMSATIWLPLYHSDIFQSRRTTLGDSQYCRVEWWIALEHVFPILYPKSFLEESSHQCSSYSTKKLVSETNVNLESFQWNLTKKCVTSITKLDAR